MKHILISIFFLSILNSISSANIINIPSDQPTIEEGINSATELDTVLVHPGIYYENLKLSKKNIILGSLFLTTGDTSYISNTIIDGQMNGIVISISSSIDTNTVITGFTVTNGSWGGISCYRGSPKLIWLNIINNNSISRGGGIHCYEFPSATMYIENVSLISNSTFGSGGAIYFENFNANLKNVTIKNNRAEKDGGGIYCKRSNIQASNLKVLNNYAENGGGIYLTNQQDSPEYYFSINDGIIGNNLAKFYGGGIFGKEKQNLILNNVRVINNKTNKSGGGFYLNGEADYNLINTTIANNVAKNQGGGLLISSKSNVIFDSVNRSNIYFNHALYGREIYSHIKLAHVFLDTFTLRNPTEFLSRDLSGISPDILDIQNGKVEPVSKDLYVGTSGSNSNDGLTPDKPLKNIWYALLKIKPDSLNNFSIYLDEGIYSSKVNDEK